MTVDRNGLTDACIIFSLIPDYIWPSFSELDHNGEVMNYDEEESRRMGH